MSVLNIYIPTDRRAALASGTSLNDRTHGAALFADISGFSQLTEALARELGPKKGAEELTQHLNRAFDTLIMESNHFGGSVIGFSGDAITCWFEGDSGLWATACALAMQKKIGQIRNIDSPSGKKISLALKAGIAVGTARRFLVGDPLIQIFDVLAGKLLDELAAAEGLSERGEVVLAPSAVDKLADHVSVSAWKSDPDPASEESFAVVDKLITELPESPSVLEVPIQLSEDQMKSWLPPLVYEQVRGGKMDFAAELRPAVALFLRFTGIDYEADDAGDKLDSFIRRVQAILSRYEATLLDLTIGDKGSYFYAAFGAPIAHEDDSLRAVSAAVELQDLAPELKAIDQIQIGISQGMMRVGTYGGTTRGTYGVHGNDVNLAARMMTRSAAGQILVTQRIHEDVVTEFDLRDLGSMPMKGHKAPLPVYEVLGKKSFSSHFSPATLSSPAVVGRVAERKALLDALASLGEGMGGSIILEGEAGIGKSRLLADVLAQAHSQEIPALVGSGSAIEMATPYYSWRAIFRGLFGLEQVENTAVPEEIILNKLPEDPIHLQRAPLLNIVLPVRLPENEFTRQMSAETRAANTRELLFQLITTKAESRPCAIIMDDVQWLDSASWALLRKVSLITQNILLVMAGRPMRFRSGDNSQPFTESVPEEYKQLHADPSVEVLQVEALPLPVIPELIMGSLGVSSLPEAVIEVINERAEGNPLLSEEVAFALRDRGLLQITGGKAVLAVNKRELREADFPDTIHGVIASRLDHLPTDQLLTLKVASVIGRVFPFRTLRDTHPVKPDRKRLLDQLDILARLDITPLETPEPNLAHHFRHAVTQEVVYDRMLFSQRRRLHYALGHWYEKEYADDLSSHYALLAHHFTNAIGDQVEDPGLVTKSLRYLEHACDVAIRQSAYQEAVTSINQALELDRQFMERSAGRQITQEGAPSLADTNRQARWLGKLGEAYRGWGHFSEGQINLEKAAALYGQPIPRPAWRLISAILGQLLQHIMHRLWPARGAEKSTHEGRAEILEVARIYQRLGEMYLFSNQKVASLYTIIRMLNLSEAAGSSPELAEALAATSLTAGLFGLHAQADYYYQRALQIAGRIDQPPILADVWRVNGLYRLGIGQWQHANTDLKNALEIHDQLGDRRHAGDCRTLLCHSAFNQGEYRKAAQMSAEIVAAGQKDENPILQIWGLYMQSSSAVRLGRLQEAIHCAESAMRLVTEHGADAAEIYCLGTLALALWRNGRVEEARRAADRVAGLISNSRAIPSAYNLLDGYVAVAEIYSGIWEMGSGNGSSDLADIKKATRKAFRALHTYRRLFPIGGPSAWLFQGLYESLSDRPAQAHKSWMKSRTAAIRLGMPYEQGRASYEIGRHLLTADPKREEHLAEARDIFAGLETPYELRQTIGVLEMG